MKLFFLSVWITLLLGFVIPTHSHGQDSTTVLFDTLPLDSMLVYMEADNYLYADTMWVTHEQSITLRSGMVIFTLMSSEYRDHKDFAILKPNATRVVKLDTTKTFSRQFPNWSNSSLVAYSKNINLMVLTEEESSVYLNDELIGMGSLLVKAPEGERINVLTIGPKGKRRYYAKIHEYQRFVGLDHYTYPSSTSVFTHKLIPGIYDFSRKNYLSSFSQIGLVVGLGMYIQDQRYKYNVLEYKHLIAVSDYRTAQNEYQAVELYDRTESLRISMNRNVVRQRLSVLGMLGVFGFNFARITRLEKKSLGSPDKVDFLSLPVFRYDPINGTYKATISTNF